MDTFLATPPAPGSILIGVDGSPGSHQALRWAAEQARLEHRPLCLVGVSTDRITSWAAGAPGFDVSEVLASIRVEVQGLLNGAVAWLALEPRPDLEVGAYLATGDPRQVLIDLSNDAAMIVLGSRGRGPVASLLLGSVSVSVTEHAHCPVVVVRPGSDDVAHGATDRVLVGVRHEGPVGPAVEFAFLQAALHGAPLSVVHGDRTATYGYDVLAGPALGGAAAADAERATAALLGDLRTKFADVVTTYVAVSGPPELSLLRSPEPGDLVVVGSPHPGVVATVIDGNAARAVTEHAHCVVAVVPEP